MVDPALNADQAADSIERESKRELNRWELSVQQQQQRPSLVAIRQHADRFHHQALELELERTRKFVIGWIGKEIAAALHGV